MIVLTSPAGAPIYVSDSLGSTNDEALLRAGQGDPGPLFIAAHRQTQARGRRGRAWSGGEGNLAVTVLTSWPDGIVLRVSDLAFVAALAVWDLATLYVERDDVGLKWPNDLLIGGAKAGGILVESLLSQARVHAAVGVGVNLITPPTGLDYPVAALADALKPGVAPPVFEEALAVFAGAFEAWSDVWRREGFEPIRLAWLARSKIAGKPCSVKLGAENLVGVALDVNGEGALRVELPSGEVRIVTTGEVCL